LAVAPSDAPQKVVAAIAAANRIANGHPYCWGGGHQSWKSSCYDCSGAVSYALHGAGLLDTPLTSGDLERWGRSGQGAWITVYANPQHAFMVIAGLRFDTADTLGNGPGWAADMGSYEQPKSFTVRSPAA
jgi:cell wall-associated NlpC family hydrolase